MNFFSSVSAAISAAIKAMEGQLAKFAAFIKPVIIASAEEVGQVALQSVLDQAPLLIRGQEKLSAAVTNVQSALVAKGKTASLSIITASVQEAHDLLSQAVHPVAP